MAIIEEDIIIEILGPDGEAGVVIEEIESRDARDERVRFHIDNDNDATSINLRVRRKASVQSVIDRMYQEFDVPRQPGDRLTREPGGRDVFPFAAQTVDEYVGDNERHERIDWAFVGDQGGAEWC